jgi:arsenate reductase|tara:strand:- start:1372 stop:1986 length:615 start_codon:yes stop_codon:yes gene_type:complete
MYPDLKQTIETLDCATLSNERKELLKPLIEYISSKVKSNDPIRIVFICTHNSRRSHLAQIWMQALAYYHGVNLFYSYSAGTEKTAVYPSVIDTLKSSGFLTEQLSKDDNPVYAVKFDDNESAVIVFSKELASNFNPKSEFAAIMTCSQADEGCPFIAGAEKRIPITYEDPKAFDNTDEEEAKYKERSLQIATELQYVFQQLTLK